MNLWWYDSNNQLIECNECVGVVSKLTCVEPGHAFDHFTP